MKKGLCPEGQQSGENAAGNVPFWRSKSDKIRRQCLLWPVSALAARGKLPRAAELQPARLATRSAPMLQPQDRVKRGATNQPAEPRLKHGFDSR